MHGRRVFDIHFLVSPSYENSKDQSFFFDQTGRFFGLRLGLTPTPLAQT
jgi:hypothetical protein